MSSRMHVALTIPMLLVELVRMQGSYLTSYAVSLSCPHELRSYHLYLRRTPLSAQPCKASSLLSVYSSP